MPQNENYTSILILESSLRRAERFIARGERDKALDMLMALLRFGAYGMEPDEDSEIYDYIESDLVIMQRARERYNHNIENGKRGGRPKKQFDKELALQLYSEGVPVDEILDSLDNCVSRATLYRFLQEANKQRENLSQNLKTTFENSQNCLKSVSESQNSFEKNFEEKENLSQNLKTVSKPNVNVNDNETVNENENENANENDNSFSAARNFETPNIKKETIPKSQNKSQNVSCSFETITDENIYEFLATTIIDNAAYNKIITSVINGSLSNVWECGEEGILNKQTQEFWEKQD